MLTGHLDFLGLFKSFTHFPTGLPYLTSLESFNVLSVFQYINMEQIPSSIPSLTFFMVTFGVMCQIYYFIFLTKFPYILIALKFHFSYLGLKLQSWSLNTR